MVTLCSFWYSVKILPYLLYTEMKLTFPLLNTTITVPVDDPINSGKISRRSMRKNRAENRISESIEKVDEMGSTEVKPPAESSEKSTEKSSITSAPQSSNQPILMVEVVNITHEKFKQTEEIKVIYK